MEQKIRSITECFFGLCCCSPETFFFCLFSAIKWSFMGWTPGFSSSPSACNLWLFPTNKTKKYVWNTRKFGHQNSGHVQLKCAEERRRALALHLNDWNVKNFNTKSISLFSLISASFLPWTSQCFLPFVPNANGPSRLLHTVEESYVLQRQARREKVGQKRIPKVALS